ncbi:MAG: preprotein translocase subunit SecG [Bacteroidia bacterium]|nr:preprotein translocase subunit SecG [Bacteroidia bacterium]
MYNFLIVIIFLVCALLVLLVLVQNSKGGGLASSFSSSNQVMGVRRTTDFLEKATWILAIALVVLAISSTAFLPRKGELQKSGIDQQIQQVQDPTQVPNFPQAVRDSTKK